MTYDGRARSKGYITVSVVSQGCSGLIFYVLGAAMAIRALSLRRACPGATPAAGAGDLPACARHSARVVQQSAQLPGGLIRLQQTCPGALFAEFVLGVAQWAVLHRQATATDTAGELVTQSRHLLDAGIQIALPLLR